MALLTKSIKGNGLTQLRSTVTSADGTIITEVETWTGPYAELKIKQIAVALTVKGTSLSPSEADHGTLTITREVVLGGSSSPLPGSITTIEVIWQQLVQDLALHPHFAILTPGELKLIRDAAAATPSEPPEGVVSVGLELYDYYLRGITSYATGVPVVRRTTTNVRGNIGSGNAWFRQNPPVSVTGTWQWLKTADERRTTGTRFDKVEEWTGATVWDPVIYP